MKTLHDQVAAFEKRLITDCLNVWDWNISHAAFELDVTRQTLYLKMKRYAIVRCPECESSGWIYKEDKPIRCVCNPEKGN